MEYKPLYPSFKSSNPGASDDDDDTLTIEPASLQAICIDLICYSHIFQTKKVMCKRPVVDANLNDFVGYDLKLGAFRLPVSLSEDLFYAMTSHKELTDQSLQMFNSRHTKLNTVCLRNLPVTLNGLQVLREHSLVEMMVENIEANIEQIVSSQVISPSTKSTLKLLSISECVMSDKTTQCFTMSQIGSTFTNLVQLSLISIKLENGGLSSLCSTLSPSISHLDISGNPITDISPLSKLSESLKSLVMYNLYSLKETNFNVLIHDLRGLRHLDISSDTGHQLEAFLNEEVSPLPVDKLLLTENSLPNLVSLDISGREVASARLVRSFINSHPGIKFIGLLLTPASYVDECDYPWCSGSIVLSALTTEKLIVDCFRRYKDRHFYIQKALVALFQMTRETISPRPSMIQLIVDIMSMHLGQVSVQMASTACLYNLTKEDLGVQMHPDILKLVVHSVLECMTKYPTNEQLQRNCLLTLCTDRMLVEVSFDKFRCAQLVMECLCKFKEDDAMIRMILAIISILAAKISTAQTSDIAANKQYMARLVEITRNKMKDQSTDRTMKFALSALWNLTDESPTACNSFARLDGIELAMNCLIEYEKVTDVDARLQVQTKVVGLLNNIAEVESLRCELINPTFINLMRKALESGNSEHSYFSAGILANLLCDSSNSAWAGLKSAYGQTECDMLAAIKDWSHPDTAMVAYRCFRPFIPLLSPHTSRAAQYWALWAISHVCVKDPKRYVPMLIRDGTHCYIVRLAERTVPHICYEVWKIAQRLYTFIDEYRLLITSSTPV